MVAEIASDLKVEPAEAYLVGLLHDIVRLHHTPIEAEIIAGSPGAMLFCVQVADHLCLSLLQCDVLGAS